VNELFKSKGSSSLYPVLLLIFGLLVGGGGGYLYMTNKYQPIIEHYDNQIAVYLVEVSSLTSSVEKLESDKLDLITQVSSLETEKDTLETETSQLISNLNQAEEKILDYELDISTLESQKESLENQVSTLDSQISSLQSSLVSSSSTITSLQSENNDLESHLEDISGIIVTQHYRWEFSPSWFSSSEWTWDLPISLGTYFSYHYKERPESWRDWINIVNDPDDDYYINSMVQHINSAAYSKGFTESEKVNFVISFVQSLPYTVDSVTTDWNEYPRYPLETLFDRGGDCEDTSILVAALLDRMGYDVCLLFLSHENHCAVGIALDGVSGSYYEHDGSNYYYLESTGDGWEIGDIPSSFTDTRAYIYPVNP